MRILITGANGFVGYYLAKHLLGNGHEVLATNRGPSKYTFGDYPGWTYREMDFTDPYAVHDVFEQWHPEAVIHTGAMSKPDDCEAKQWEAYLVNVEGTVTLLTNCEEQGSFFIFLSTDFIFNGDNGPYREDDPATPINVYGRTKWEAEEAVREYLHPWAIVRTVLVYGKPADARGNLVSVLKDKLEKGESYKVVTDQWRTPTYVEDLVNGIVRVVEQRATGVYHISGEEMTRPYDMALEVARLLGKDPSLIIPATASDFTAAAKRPSKTGFYIDKAKEKLGFQPLSIIDGLKRTLQ